MQRPVQKLLLAALLPLAGGLLGGCAAPLQDAAAKGNLATVQKLVENGANVNRRDGTGNTPLIVAALNGQTKVAKYLLDQGADIHRNAAWGYDALTYACLRNQQQTVKLLLERGAHPKLVLDRYADFGPFTPLAPETETLLKTALAPAAPPTPAPTPSHAPKPTIPPSKQEKNPKPQPSAETAQPLL